MLQPRILFSKDLSVFTYYPIVLDFTLVLLPLVDGLAGLDYVEYLSISAYYPIPLDLTLAMLPLVAGLVGFFLTLLTGSFIAIPVNSQTASMRYLWV